MPLALFSKQKAVPDDNFDIELDDRKIRVNVTRNRNARRFILRVSAATRSVNLTLPSRGSMRDAHNFVDRHQDWLKTQFAQLPDPRPFAPGAIVPLRDTPHQILNVATGRGVVQISKTDDDLPTLCVSGDPAHLPRRLTDWFKKQARADLARQVAIHADILGVRRERSACAIRGRAGGRALPTGRYLFRGAWYWHRPMYWIMWRPMKLRICGK